MICYFSIRYTFTRQNFTWKIYKLVFILLRTKDCKFHYIVPMSYYQIQVKKFSLEQMLTFSTKTRIFDQQYIYHLKFVKKSINLRLLHPINFEFPSTNSNGYKISRCIYLRTNNNRVIYWVKYSKKTECFYQVFYNKNFYLVLKSQIITISRHRFD